MEKKEKSSNFIKEKHPKKLLLSNTLAKMKTKQKQKNSKIAQIPTRVSQSKNETS